MKITVTNKKPVKKQSPITIQTVCEQLNKKIDHDFFHVVHDGEIRSGKNCSNLERHVKLIGLLCLYFVKHGDYTFNYIHLGHDGFACKIILMNKESLFSMHEFLNGFDRVEDLDINFEI